MSSRGGAVFAERPRSGDDQPDVASAEDAFILANSASGRAGNIARVGSLPTTLWVWTGIVTVGGLINSELGSRRVTVSTFRRLLGIVLLVAGNKLVGAI